MKDGFVKSPDAALRYIIRHCGVRKVRLTPQDLRALPAKLLTKPSSLVNFSTFYEFIMKGDRHRSFCVFRVSEKISYHDIFSQALRPDNEGKCKRCFLAGSFRTICGGWGV